MTALAAEAPYGAPILKNLFSASARRCDGGAVMISTSRLVIIGLVAVVAVLGYLYYESTRNDVVISMPSIELKP